MKIKFISPIDKTTPMLFDTLIPTFKEQGHEIVDRVEDATVVFHDLYSMLGTYDKLDSDKIFNKKVPVVAFDATDYGGMSKEIWDNKLWEEVSQRQKVVYFMRKMDKSKKYPLWVHPYELIQYPDHDFAPVSKEDLFNRPYDVCFIGAESPQRKNFINSLVKDGEIKADYQFTTERVSHEQWLNRHRQSKFFIESDGGGYGSERPYQLITIAPMLKQVNNQLIRNDFISGLDCVKIGTGDGFISDIELIAFKYFLQSKEGLYSIYQKGIQRMHRYFNANYRSQYILDILNKEGIC